MARPDFRATAVRRLSEEGEISPAIVRFLSPERHGRPTEARVLPIESIQTNPGRARAGAASADLLGLAASITRHGLLQPILVRPAGDDCYVVVAGERRWRAAKLAGLTAVPVLVEDLDDRTALEISIVANIQRKDLSRLDEGAAFERMIITHGYSVKQLARQVGRRKRYVRRRLALVARARVREERIRARVERGRAKGKRSAR